MKFTHEHYYILASGTLCVLLGAVVILGWYQGNISLIQVNPSFAPMQYNTALGFFLGGAGALMLAVRLDTMARIMGAIVAAIGGLTLSEYIFDIDLGIDQLLMDQTIMTRATHPGRMAPNTSLCFLLTGMSIFLGEKKRAAMVGLGSAALALAVLALSGYLSSEGGLYGWGNLTRMAIHTATGFLVLNAGLVAYAFLRKSRGSMDIWGLTPLSMTAIVIVITFFSWYATIESGRARNKDYFNTLVAEMQVALNSRYLLYEQSLWGGLGLFYASETVERREWARYVEALDIETHLPGISGLGYIDYVLAQDIPLYLKRSRADDAPTFLNHPDTFYPDKFIIKFIEPEDRNMKAVGLDVGFEANRRAAAERARDLGAPALTKKIELVQDNEKLPGFLLLVPVYDIKQVPETLKERRAHFAGWVYAPFIGRNFLQGLGDISRNEIGFTVYDGRKTVPEAMIYESGNNVSGSAAWDGQSKMTRMSIAGRTWTVVWETTALFNPPIHKKIALIVLLSGTLFAIFLYMLLTQMVRRKEIIDAEVERQTAVIKAHDKERENLVQELAKSNEDLERFAYVASHDLQEPLRMVRSFTGLLEEQYADKLDDTAKQYIDFAHSSAGRMQALVHDLLEYSRIGSEAEKLEDVDVSDLLGTVIENLQDRIKETAAEITYDEMPIARCNPVRLTRVLQNLIGNGIKYQEAGNTPKIHVSAELEGDYWLFCITDNGIGIKREYAQKVFEPFKRLHGKGEYSGTGMGLAICKRIIEGYGGRIWIGSEEQEQGTRFYFTVPKTL